MASDRKQPSFSSWFFYILTVTVLAAAYVRHSLFDAKDAYKCNAALSTGQWLDSAAQGRGNKPYAHWQPESCMLRTYSGKKISGCLGDQKQEVSFIGDSTVRNIFWAVARQLDSKKAKSENSNAEKTGEKHVDLSFTALETTLSFHWDPYLNSTYLMQYLGPSPSSTKTRELSTGRSTLVIGGGLWFALNELRPVEKYKDAIDHITENLDAPSHASLGAHRPLIVPVLPPFYERLDAAHSELRADKIDAMNSYLLDIQERHDVDVLNSFTAMTEREPKEAFELSGLHAIPAIANQQAQVILNLKCNNKEKTYSFDGTCCYQYPFDIGATSLFIVEAVLLAAVAWVELQQYTGQRADGFMEKVQKQMPLIKSMLVMLVALTYAYICDRTQLFGKISKLYNSQDFWIMVFLIALAGVSTIKESGSPQRPGQEKAAIVDQPFLSRDQTDEWKGWMQVAILAYHYTGASKVLPIYKFIRLLVASYLFMTGYGHTSYFYQKNDFSIKRVVAVNLRINLLSALLPWMMKTDYLFYYFAPLVTYWYAVIYVTMRIKSEWNQDLKLFLAKIGVACALTTFLHTQEWLLNPVFIVINSIFGSKWEAREWLFRVALDQFIVYIGMIVSVLYIRASKPPAPAPPPQGSMTAAPAHTAPGASPHLRNGLYFGASAAMLATYFWLQSYGTTKSSSNQLHTYISPLPILAFIHLRNSTRSLRNHYSTAYAWVGKISLETFVLQYHLWLAADTKGLLNLGWFGTGGMGDGQGLLGHGMGFGRWADCIVLGLVFVWISWKVADATGAVTASIVKLLF